MNKEIVNPCLNCGACCHDLLLDVAEEQASVVGAQHFLKLSSEVGRASLSGDCQKLCRSESSTLCSVYGSELRPSFCLEFEVGSLSCRIARERDELPPVHKLIIDSLRPNL